MSQTQFHKITTRETIYKQKRKFSIGVHKGRGQNFPIVICCRYLVELGLGHLGLPVADLSVGPFCGRFLISDPPLLLCLGRKKDLRSLSNSKLPTFASFKSSDSVWCWLDMHTLDLAVQAAWQVGPPSGKPP